MAKPEDVVRALDTMHAETATKIARAPTGVTPGYHAVLGGTVTEDGRLRYVGGGTGLLAQYELDTDTTRTAGNTARINFDVQLYDPNSLVTTGASWHFTPPAAGIYRFTLSTIIVPGAALAAGEKLYAILWPDGGGTGLMTLAWEEAGVTETGTRDQVLLQGSLTRACTTSDAVHVRFSNGTGNSVTQQGNNVEPYSTMLTIERLS